MQHQPHIDQPSAVRAGETLDAERLAAYLRDQLPNADAPLQVAQFPSGFSNLTYLLRFGEREVVLRRPPFGVAGKHAHDMAREYRILVGLSATDTNVPRPLLLCEDDSVIGAPFYVMERVSGLILRHPLPDGLDLPPAEMRRVCLALIDAQVALHRLDYHAAGLGDLGRPDGYTARQVGGWTKRYAAARTDDIADMDHAAAWLRDHIPAHADAALIHNDYRYDNVVLNAADPTQITAILDWELATIGEPLTDVGTTLAYWAEPGDPAALQQFGVTLLPGNLNRQEYVERYAAQSGRDMSDMLFYFVYGLFKNAVIVQQIYARYQQGLTHDPRFATLIDMVRVYSRLATRAVAQGRVSDLFD